MGKVIVTILGPDSSTARQILGRYKTKITKELPGDDGVSTVWHVDFDDARDCQNAVDTLHREMEGFVRATVETTVH